MPGRVGVARGDELPGGGGELASRRVGRRDGRRRCRAAGSLTGRLTGSGGDGRRRAGRRSCSRNSVFVQGGRGTRVGVGVGVAIGRGRQRQSTETVCFVCAENAGLFLSLVDGTQEILVENGLSRGKDETRGQGQRWRPSFWFWGGGADGDRGWREVVEKRCGPG